MLNKSQDGTKIHFKKNINNIIGFVLSSRQSIFLNYYLILCYYYKNNNDLIQILVDCLIDKFKPGAHRIKNKFI